MLKKCVRVWLCLLLLYFNSTVYANDSQTSSYTWGRGYHIPALNLTLGGYFNAVYRHFDAQGDHLDLDDLSLFISWQPFNRIHLFSELELEDMFSLDGVKSFSDSFRVERLYADFFVTDSITFRTGQYLTPFSRWELLHAAPLVWTTSRPIITTGNVIPLHAIGLEVLYRTELFQRELNVSFYADDSENLRVWKLDNPFNYAFGSRMTYQMHPTLNIGMSYVFSKVDSAGQEISQHAMGLDFLWKKQQYELQLESIAKVRVDKKPLYGLYLQAVAPLLDTFYAVGRYEYVFDSDLLSSNLFQNNPTQLGIVGLAWRPAAPIILKLEYRFGENNQYNAPSGVLSSISMFF